MAKVVGPLPASFVLTERAVASLRAYLVAHDLSDYRIFFCTNFDLHDIDTHLKALGEEAEWEAVASFTTPGEAVDLLSHDNSKAWDCRAGFLRLDGKTSMIRAAGAALPKISAMILRQSEGFDTDELENVLDRWRRQAPAMLVIEDLNWLLERTKVSAFLNLLDGIDSKLTGGLLLIATTNYPEKLDPAVNNRPGRFDVVIEVPCPDRALRLEFLALKLPGMDEAAVRRVVEMTDGMSFAHLQEVLRFSGLLAIADHRSERSPDDLVRAAKTVRQGHEDAGRGFCPLPETPFGLAGLRERRR